MTKKQEGKHLYQTPAAIKSGIKWFKNGHADPLFACGKCYKFVELNMSLEDLLKVVPVRAYPRKHFEKKHDLVVVEKKGKSGAILQQGGQATEGSKCYSFKKHVPAELIKALPTVDFNKAFVCGDCDDKVDVNATVFEIMTYKIITKERMYEHFISKHAKALFIKYCPFPIVDKVLDVESGKKVEQMVPCGIEIHGVGDFTLEEHLKTHATGDPEDPLGVPCFGKCKEPFFDKTSFARHRLSAHPAIDSFKPVMHSTREVKHQEGVKDIVLTVDLFLQAHTQVWGALSYVYAGDEPGDVFDLIKEGNALFDEGWSIDELHNAGNLEAAIACARARYNIDVD